MSFGKFVSKGWCKNLIRDEVISLQSKTHTHTHAWQVSYVMGLIFIPHSRTQEFSWVKRSKGNKGVRDKTTSAVVISCWHFAKQWLDLSVVVCNWEHTWLVIAETGCARVGFSQWLARTRSHHIDSEAGKADWDRRLLIAPTPLRVTAGGPWNRVRVIVRTALK